MGSLLITNGQLVTLDETNRFIANGSVYIEGRTIVEVGDSATVRRSADPHIDARGCTV